MRRWTGLGAVMVLWMGVAAAPAAAQGRSGEKPQKAGSTVDSHGSLAVISDVEIRIIRDYYGALKTKPKPLPPGTAKNLARGKPLPPGIAKNRMPDDLVKLLRVRKDYQWLVEGNLVVLVDPVGLVVDILRDIF